MNNKSKWVLSISLLWGLPFWSCFSFYIWAIENKPITLTYLLFVLILSILGGAFVGYVTSLYNKNIRNPKSLIKPVLIMTTSFYSYLAILKFLLIPNALENTWVNALFMIVLVALITYLEVKFFYKKREKKD